MSELLSKKGLERLNALVKRAKVITFQQVNDLLPDDLEDVAEIDAIYEALRTQNVELIDQDDIGELNDELRAHLEESILLLAAEEAAEG